MAEIASLNARKRVANGSRHVAAFVLHDDGAITRQITSINGVPEDRQPEQFRRVDEDDLRRYCTDATRARIHLAGILDAEGWMVTTS
jgi:hypothetical protein